MQLDLNKVYLVEVKERKEKRSNEQNRMLWKLIHQIAKYTHQDDMDVYCSCLERADALSDYVITIDDIEDKLRKNFRGVRFVRRQELNGVNCYVYKVYLGSSSMSTKEMTQLIDVCNQICAELGIPFVGMENL